MKTISIVMIAGIFLVFTRINAFSQNDNHAKPSVVKPYNLAINYFKTTNLIFPYAIKSVDRGSKDVLAQKTKGVENILQVKAGRQGFDETNLTVITADGKLYSFVLNYDIYPAVLNLQFGGRSKPLINAALFSQANYNEAVIQTDAENVAAEKRNIRRIKDRKYGMTFWLSGLFICNDVMYFQIKVSNQTNIDYGIDQLRFFIRDQKKIKRTATQELELKPLHVHGNTSIVVGQSEHTLVFAIKKFTIPDQKYLAIQLIEKNGGRNLHLKVSNREIIKAKLF